ncbi:MAG: hypothetical protein K9L24_01145 [Spirochaetia bacterium]|nr:hypothetical protein [Spirochaetia bacterium]
MYKRQFTGVTIGGPENNVGEEAARTKRFPITGLSVLQTAPNKSDDEVITGRNAKRGMYVDSVDLNAEIPCYFEACGAVGMGIAGTLGGEVGSPQEVGGALLVKYVGSEQSAKISVSGSDIQSEVGDLGGESADENFGTSGTLAPTGTIADLLSTIEGYTDYAAEKLFGADDLDVTSPIAITATQAKGRYAVIFFGETGSGKYLHKFVSVLDNTELPTYSVQYDGSGANELGKGGVFDSLSISADLKGRANITFSLIHTEKDGGQEKSTVQLPAVSAMKFSNGKTIVSGTEHTYTKSVSVEIANNVDGDEGFGQGSLYKQNHARGMFSANGSVSLRATAITETERAKVESNNEGSLQLFFEGGTKEIAFIDLPNICYTDESKSEGGVSIEQSLSFDALDKNSYDDMISMYLVTDDEAAY